MMSYQEKIGGKAFQTPHWGEATVRFDLRPAVSVPLLHRSSLSQSALCIDFRKHTKKTAHAHALCKQVELKLQKI